MTVREVTLLSGFLGSGKTTLLRAELERAGAAAPALIVNDFAGTVVDDLGERRITLSGGCACCTRREDLARALAGLLDGPAAPVVIETSGLSDPGPIAFTVASDPVLKHHYALSRIRVTVDALTGLPDHEVALRQVLAADELIVTKADLAGEVEPLVTRLRELNPSAGIAVTANGEPLRVEPGTGRGRRRTGSPEHVAGVATLELTTAEPIDWQAFSIWLSLLLQEHGPQVLRVKGVLEVENVGAVAINGVRHVIHRPEHLTGPVPPGTRLVIIADGVDMELLERSFRTFLRLGS